MQRNNTPNSEITFLVEDIEAVLEMNRFLEKENEELKTEVARLKSQIVSLKAHDIERKSILWKKFQYPNNIDNKEGIPKKQIAQTPEQSQKSVSESKKPSPPPPPPPPCKVIVSENSATTPPKKGPPPPPPPLPSKSLVGSKLAVRRVPEVIDFYRYLNRRNAQIENRTNVTGTPRDGNPSNMIGEIENRSMYLTAVSNFGLVFPGYLL